MNPKPAPAPAGGRSAPAPAISVTRTLEFADPRIARLIAAEDERQRRKLILIASESLCPKPVREAVASSLSNLYAEGYPSTRMALHERDWLDLDARHLSFYRRYGDRRYYKGCDYANLVEAEAIRRLTELFATPEVPAHEIFANVQPLSGAAANNAVYEALVPAESTVMGMHLSTGGHLTHGSPVNRSGKHFRIVPYVVDPATGRIDFEKLRADALREKPKLIIAGYSAYPWQIDWARFRAVADECGAFLLADIAHPAGLVAAGEFPSPIGHAHVVSFTTHKTLCGPRGAVILTTDAELARRIDLAVFPGEQGGPHLNQIAGKAVAFRLARGEEFRRLMRAVRENAAALAAGLSRAGFELAYGGTDTHLCLVDLRKRISSTGEPVSADLAARVLDLVGITCNKNSIHGDTRALFPSGLRFGTCWVSQRGLDADAMEELAGTIGDTLGAMRAFSVHTAAGRVGRVRLPASALRSAQQRVRRLIERGDGEGFGAFSYPHYDASDPAARARPRVASLADAGASAAALERGAALVDTSLAPAILVTGERAGLALQHALAGDLLRLAPGRAAQARALDGSARLIADVLVARLSDDEHGFERFVLLADSQPAQDLLQWLRDLSDGMVAFDDDLMRKIDGPVVVEDLGTLLDDGGRRVRLTVAGAGAAAALAAAGVREPIAPGAVTGARIEGGEAWVIGAPDRGEGGRIEIVLPPEAADALAKSLRASLPVASEAAFVEWKRRRGAPAPGDAVAARPEDAARPWFIGQAALPAAAAAGRPLDPFSAPPRAEVLRFTALHGWHKSHTKKWNLVDFAGWEMPVLYGSIVEEHAAVRTAAGLFDVSHMGVLEVRGERAGCFLDRVTTNYVARLRDGEGQYSYALAPDGSVLDDLLIYRRARDRFLVVVNASNAEVIEAWWRGVLAGRHAIDPRRPQVRLDVDAELVNLKDPAAGGERRVDLAFQGPQSLPVLLELCEDEGSRRALARLKRFHLAEARIAGTELLAARTGYTGEEVGFELYVHPDRQLAVWEAILERGRDRGVLPAGLGARDSTRTEAGFPLYGHELAGEHDIGPHGAGYASFVKFHKPFFVGRDALVEREKSRTNRILRARVTDPSARPVRAGDTVVDAKGRYVGRVTSAAFAGAEQILLAWAEQDSLAKGARIGVFTLPRDRKKLPPEPAKDALAPGDSVLLPVPAEVIPRFLSAAEKSRRSYRKP